MKPILFRRWFLWGFYALIALLAYIAVARLSFVSQRLIDGQALDFTSRYIAVQQWFSGESFYSQRSSTYPPASYLLLWPLLGWLSLETASRVWGVICVLSLAWLAKLFVGYQPIRSPSQRWFLVAVMLAMTATSAALWLGQFVPVLLALITASILLIHPPHGEKVGWKREFAAGILMAFALVKPSVSLPFLWLLLWSPARLRLGISVVLGYVVFTFISLWFQKNGLQEVVGWAETVNRNGAQLSEGYANLRVWLASVGLKSWSHPAALLVFLWLGFWSYLYRRADIWLRLGVTALVARLWTYHNSYDDLLLILPLLVLLQIGNEPVSSTRFWNETRQAQCLFVVLVLLLLLLPHWLFADSLSGFALRGLSGLTMILALAFLLNFARKSRRNTQFSQTENGVRALT